MSFMEATITYGETSKSRSTKKISLVGGFAHCSQPDKFEAVRSRFQRVHDCQLLKPSLT